MIIPSIKFSFRTLLIVIFALAASGLLLGSGDVDAGSGETEFRWLITSNSISQGNNGFCDESPIGTVCREECLVYVDTGIEVPSGRIACFPI